MKTFLTSLLTAFLTAVLFLLFMPRSEVIETKKPSVYERVINSGVIRCGYTPYSVGLQKDANTGKLSGIYYDVMQELGKNLNLRVEYVEETGWGQQIEGLEAGRFDMICSPASLNSGRARAADFSIPLYYSPVQVWARADDTRFDTNSAAIDNPEVKISVLDGEQTSVFARNFFPKAVTVSLPQTAPFSDLLLQVTTDKADITFAEPLAVNEFMASNGTLLRAVKMDRPLVTVPNILLLPRDQYAFKQMIDNGLRELFNTGYIDRTIDKYETYPHSYLRETALR